MKLPRWARALLGMQPEEKIRKAVRKRVLRQRIQRSAPPGTTVRYGKDDDDTVTLQPGRHFKS